MSEKLLSIIIPVYNVEKYLGKCIDSIFVDNHFPKFNELIEVIAINDGATDNSPVILDEYAQKYPLKICSKNNGGQSSARNMGIKAACGKYIQFIDSDDYLFPCKLQKIIGYLQHNSNCDLLLYNYANFTDGKNDFNPKITGCAFSQLDGQTVLSELLKKDIFSAFPWNKITKKTLIENNSLYFIEGIINEDTEWGAKVLALAENVGYLNEIVYAYRHRAGSTIDRPMRNHKSYASNLAVLESLENFRNSNFSDKFKNTFIYAMTGAFWIVWINSHFEGSLELVEQKYGHIMPYCKCSRRIFYRILIKIFGIERFYKWKYKK